MQDDIATRWVTLEDISQMSVSYAQNCEDVLLARVFGKGYAGLYVDVGANDPVFHSVTKLLYERGWHGVNIEPMPILHQRLVADRSRDVNLNCGISDAEGTLTFYEVAPPLHGWSTFMPEVAAAYRTYENVFPTEKPIPVTTLNRVFEQYVGNQTVDVLKIDAEGFEKQVVSSIDLKKWRPRVILIEATWCSYWEHMILGANYKMAAFDGLNRYYVRAEDPDLLVPFAIPVCLFDNYIPHHFARLILQEPPQPAAQPPAPPEPAPAVPEPAPVPVPVPEPVPAPVVYRRQSDIAFRGPTAFNIALRLRDAARKNPKMAGVVKRLLRLVG
jgi:FkbM family methyltransferase